MATKTAEAPADGRPGRKFRIRPAVSEDVARVIALDETNTGVAKPDYWQDLFDRHARRRKNRFFLIAEGEQGFLGFIIGEIRAWEFGSPPCGWVFAIGVEPEARLHNIGTQLFDAICHCFRGAGVEKVRTMLARDDNLNMSFFRSQGMMAGPFIQLEKDLDQ